MVNLTNASVLFGTSENATFFFFLPNVHLMKSKTEMTVGYSKTVLCTGRVYRRNVNIYISIVT